MDAANDLEDIGRKVTIKKQCLMHGQATNKTNYFDKKEEWAWFQRPNHLLGPFLDRFEIELKG